MILIMTQIFEIKEGTKDYENAERAFTWKTAWESDEVLAEFEDAMILVRQERGVSEYAVAGVGALYVFRQVVGTHREWAAA